MVCLGVPTVSSAQSGDWVDWYKEYNDSLQGIRLPEAMHYLASQKLRPKKQVVVGIIDSGIDTTLVDLKPAL